MGASSLEKEGCVEAHAGRACRRPTVSLRKKIPKRKKISFSGFRYEIERNTIDYTGSALSAARTGSGFPENPEGLVAENRRALDFAARRHGGVAGRLIEAVIA